MKHGIEKRGVTLMDKSIADRRAYDRVKHERIDLGKLVEDARVAEYERGFEDGVQHAMEQLKDKYGVLDAAKIAAAVGMLA